MQESSYLARYWHFNDAWPHEVQPVVPCDCKLHEGQRGACFARVRQDNKMIFATHCHSSGSCIDPIEKKPLNHFYPGNRVLSLGAAGCNLACKFCQNWDISKSRDMDRLMDQATSLAIAAEALKYG